VTTGFSAKLVQWQPAARLPAHVPGWCCQCAETATDDEWAATMASGLLGEPEWRIWQALPRPSRQRRWMRGRVAAKAAVQRLVRERRHGEVPPQALWIVPDANGQPQVACPTRPELGNDICVSISHCGSSSVALATERSARCRGVGIDIASQTDNHAGLAEGGFTAAETALLNDLPASESGDWLLRLWCAKEAVGKALGVGLQGNPHNFVIDRIDPVRRAVELVVRIAAAPGKPAAHPERMTALVGCDRGLAFAVASLGGR
jgi:phosphopantetheinyl transferase